MSSPKNEALALGRLWWCADNMEEALRWQSDYLGRGAIEIELRPEDDRPIVDVFITLDRSRAREILGQEVGDEEWLSNDDRPGTEEPA